MFQVGSDYSPSDWNDLEVKAGTPVANVLMFFVWCQCVIICFHMLPIIQAHWNIFKHIYINIKWQQNMSNHLNHVQSCLTSSIWHHHLISSLLILILIITSTNTIIIIIITTSQWRPSDVRWSSPILKHLLWISEAFSINCRCLLSLYVLKALHKCKGWTLKNVLPGNIFHRLSTVYVFLYVN